MTPNPAGCDPAGPLLRVLCVDDNIDVADSTTELLRLVGFEARACYDGPSALAEVPTFRPGVCFIDLNMPVMDGDELAVRLRALAESPLVLVAMTARDDPVCRERIKAAGFNLHLIKPVDPHKLLAVVDELWRAWSHAHHCYWLPGKRKIRPVIAARIRSLRADLSPG